MSRRKIRSKGHDKDSIICEHCGVGYPAVAQSLEDLQETEAWKEVAFPCLMAIWEANGCGLVIYDENTGQVYVPGKPGTTKDGQMAVHFHPDLVAEFAESMDRLQGAGLIQIVRGGSA